MEIREVIEGLAFQGMSLDEALDVIEARVKIQKLMHRPVKKGRLTRIIGGEFGKTSPQQIAKRLAAAVKSGKLGGRSAQGMLSYLLVVNDPKKPHNRGNRAKAALYKKASKAKELLSKELEEKPKK